MPRAEAASFLPRGAGLNRDQLHIAVQVHNSDLPLCIDSNDAFVKSIYQGFKLFYQPANFIFHSILFQSYVNKVAKTKQGNRLMIY